MLLIHLTFGVALGVCLVEALPHEDEKHYHYEDHHDHYGHHDDGKMEHYHYHEEPHHHHHHINYHDFEDHHEETYHYPHGHQHHEEEEEEEYFARKLVKKEAEQVKKRETTLPTSETNSQEQIHVPSQPYPEIFELGDVDEQFRTARQSAGDDPDPLPQLLVKRSTKCVSGSQAYEKQSEESISRTSRQSGEYKPYPLPPFFVNPSAESASGGQVQENPSEESNQQLLGHDGHGIRKPILQLASGGLDEPLHLPPMAAANPSVESVSGGQVQEKPSKESIVSNSGHQHHSGPPPFYSEPEVILPVFKSTEVKRPSRQGEYYEENPVRQLLVSPSVKCVSGCLVEEKSSHRTSRQSEDYKEYPLPAFFVNPSVESASGSQEQESNQQLLGHDGHGIRKPILQSASGGLDEPLHLPPMVAANPSVESVSNFGHQHHSGPPPFYSEPEVILPVFKSTEVKRQQYRPSRQSGYYESYPVRRLLANPSVDSTSGSQVQEKPSKESKPESNHHLLGHDGHGIRKPILRSASGDLDEPIYVPPMFIAKPSFESVSSSQVQEKPSKKPSEESIFGNFGHQPHRGPPPFYSEPDIHLPIRVLKSTEVKKKHNASTRITRESISKRSVPVVNEKVILLPCEDALSLPPPLCITPRPDSKPESNPHLLGHDGHGIRKPILQSAAGGLDEPLHLPPMAAASTA